MIKFIASDLDGTLLDPNGNLPKEIFSIIETLYSKNILFCPASGRQLVALKKMFEPVADKILIIAENGAIVAHGNTVLYQDSIPKRKIDKALACVRTLDRVYPLLCTAECAYYESIDQPFLQYVQASYIANEKSPLQFIAENRSVCKIAVYDALSPEKNSMKVLPKALKGQRVIQSGGNWLDISEKHSNKGRAVRFIRKQFGFKKSECAAFGDHMNDFEMLRACKFAFVTENAYPRLKEKIRSVVPSNADNGVCLTLNKIIDGTLSLR